MNPIPLEIIVPIYNEGEKLIKLLNLFETNIKTKFRVLLCYDSDQDDIFQFLKKIETFKYEIILVKNLLSGPCAAVKQGLRFGNSECKIVFPADDFLNINLIDKMFLLFKQGNEVVVPSRHARRNNDWVPSYKRDFSENCFYNIIYFFKYWGKRRYKRV